MPHSKGQFVLAYQWDNHCQTIFDKFNGNYLHILKELRQLDDQDAYDAENLLYYYMKWHYNKSLYDYTTTAIDRKCDVINSLGYRGYGVNIDLLNAIGALKKDHAEHLYLLLTARFNKYTATIRQFIDFSGADEAAMNSAQIIKGLCAILGRDAQVNTPVVSQPIHL
ncbi:MAG: hypothetical protein HQK97_12635, partial [Nitrospirae bacterium]|nr:hypothetical protein [Nitrospirota bacterium]